MGWEPTSTVLDKLRTFDERSAWEELFRRFHGPVLAFARRMGLGEADAEDVAQETLAAFARSFREGRYDRARGTLEQWLFGIARRQVRAALRRRGDPRLVRTADLGARSSFLRGHADPREAPSIWREEWQREMFRRCLERVRGEVAPATFDLFRRVVLEGQEVAAVVRELGVPRGRVYNAKYRVEKRLAQLAEEFARAEP